MTEQPIVVCRAPGDRLIKRGGTRRLNYSNVGSFGRCGPDASLRVDRERQSARRGTQGENKVHRRGLTGRSRPRRTLGQIEGCGSEGTAIASLAQGQQASRRYRCCDRIVHHIRRCDRAISDTRPLATEHFPIYWKVTHCSRSLVPAARSA